MPEGQVVQSDCWPPLAPPRYVPAAQEVGVVVARGQYWPAGQARQADELMLPVLELYRPTLQLVGVVDCVGQ